MKCGHCRDSFGDANPSETFLDRDVDGRWGIAGYKCPTCNRLNLFLLQNVESHRSGVPHTTWSEKSRVLIYPKTSRRPPCPPEVPAFIAEDYTEACLVLVDSPKASAALSRRCLQNLLRDVAHVKPGKLDNEIQEVLDSHTLPSHLADNIDAIRQVGNFAAHPIKSQSTGMIEPVEPEEAEWNLDVLEALFDFYCVAPAKAAAKRAALNKKLADAGKRPMK